MSISRRNILQNELRPADILVTTGRAMESGAIRQSTVTDFSHALLYAGDGLIVEAINDGVVERELSKALSEATLAVALRRRMMNGQLRREVIRVARDFASQKLP